MKVMGVKQAKVTISSQKPYMGFKKDNSVFKGKYVQN